MAAGFSFVCVFHYCINKVQCVVSPCCKVHMLVELGRTKTVFKLAWLKSPAMMKKPSGLLVCCSVMAMYGSRSAYLVFAHGECTQRQ